MYRRDSTGNLSPDEIFGLIATLKGEEGEGKATLRLRWSPQLPESIAELVGDNRGRGIQKSLFLKRINSSENSIYP